MPVTSSLLFMSSFTSPNSYFRTLQLSFPPEDIERELRIAVLKIAHRPMRYIAVFTLYLRYIYAVFTLYLHYIYAVFTLYLRYIYAVSATAHSNTSHHSQSPITSVPFSWDRCGRWEGTGGRHGNVQYPTTSTTPTELNCTVTDLRFIWIRFQ